MIRATGRGNLKPTEEFLNRLHKKTIFDGLDRYGQLGVAALSSNTPIDSGETALSWHYRIIKDARRVRIEWYNTNVDDNGTSIAILIQYGHATRSGGFIQGRDFINPALQGIFDQIADDVWKKVNA